MKVKHALDKINDREKVIEGLEKIVSVLIQEHELNNAIMEKAGIESGVWTILNHAKGIIRDDKARIEKILYESEIGLE